MKKFIPLLFITFLLTGCASIFNPYDDEFTCPKTEEGKCVSILTAYDESLRQKNDKTPKESKNPEDNQKIDIPQGDITSDYTNALFLRLQKLLKEPRTPMLYPPIVVRVLILPYEDGTDFYNARYIYTIVDSPRWILQNVLSLPVDVEGELNLNNLQPSCKSNSCPK